VVGVIGIGVEGFVVSLIQGGQALITSQLFGNRPIRRGEITAGIAFRIRNWGENKTNGGQLC